MPQLNDIRTFEELDDASARPDGPKFDNLSPLREVAGKRLAMIHRMYRKELSAVARLMGEIKSGVASPDRLPPAIAGLSLGENLSRFGSICGQECRILQNHHDIEEHHMYPALSSAFGQDEAGRILDTVIARLKAEHRLIHTLIDELYASAEKLADSADASDFARVERDFTQLDRAIRSHFTYEEVELAPAIAASGIAI